MQLVQTLQRFLAELQRRKVLRVAATYLVGAWVVLQVAVALQTAWAYSAAFSGTILNLLIVGFPVAVGLAWFFEITPEGIKRTTSTGDGVRAKMQTTDFALAGALALVFVIGAAQLFWPRATVPGAETAAAGDAKTAEVGKPKAEPPRLGDKSVAVLPFANLSPDKENEYFADGLTEEILNILAKIGDLKVISRTSSFAFKGKSVAVPEIAKQLGVRHILEGSVRAQGDELKVTAQLIDVTTDSHLWSETYERKLDNIFAVQDEIARDIAGALSVEVTLGEAARDAPTKSLEAYRLFLKAGVFRVRRKEGDLLQSVELYKRAIELDPAFAEAQAGLATSYTAMAQEPGAPSKDLRDLAWRAAKAALAMKPNLGRAYGAMGTLARQEFDWQTAVESYSKAIALDPSDAIALASLANMRIMIGEFDKARQLLDEAVTIDPLYNHLSAPLAIVNAFARNDDRTVLALADRYTKASGNLRALGYGAFAVLARERGDIAEAERNYRAGVKQAGRPAAFVESVVRALRNKSAFAEAAKAVRDQAAKDPTFDPEAVFVLIGDHQRFFDSLDERIQRGDTARFPGWISYAWHLVAADDEAYQRFKRLVRNIGLVDYWKTHSWPDRCRAKGEDDFECN